MAERVTMTINAGVADVRLSRPEKLNALDAAMFAALIEAGEALKARKDVRAVVLSGEGRAFCAGLDFSMFGSMLSRSEAEDPSSTESLLQRTSSSGAANRAQFVCTVWQDIPVPVIAAVAGVAYGGGLQIALGADLRYVHHDARLALREIAWGIIPDMAGTQALRHLVGLDVAKEMTWTAREITGSEAVSLGLATRVCSDPRAEALATATTIAQHSPDAIRAAKQLLNASVQCSREQGHALEEKLQRSLIGGPNQLEAVQAGLAKRRPQYRDPA